MTSGVGQRGVSVEIRGLRKSYSGQEVLRGLDLSVAPGEIVVIMGPSGSGKSVLLKQIIGLEPPEAGEIRIDGEMVSSEGLQDRVRLAMVFQSGALLNSLTVAENVGLYLSEHRLKSPEEIAQIVREKLAIVGLKGIEEKMPSELSGGMKKRVSIARALVIEPQLLLYDEPTSELDPLSAVTISREIVGLNRRIGATSIVVTHDRDLALTIAHRLAFIHDGRILAMGLPSEIQAHQNPVVRQFIHAEFKEPNAAPAGVA